MRRYELMLVLRPDVPDDRSQTIIDRTTRQVIAAEGQIVKVSPWGRRRLAYPIDRHREGSYHIVLFDAPAGVVVELERSLKITEEVLRHLITRIEKPVLSAPREEADEDGRDEDDIPSDDRDDNRGGNRERIDESESEAAPAAID